VLGTYTKMFSTTPPQSSAPPQSAPAPAGGEFTRIFQSHAQTATPSSVLLQPQTAAKPSPAAQRAARRGLVPMMIGLGVLLVIFVGILIFFLVNR
jgi:hypothetical protein